MSIIKMGNVDGFNWDDDPDDPYVHDDDTVSKYVLDPEMETELTKLLTAEPTGDSKSKYIDEMITEILRKIVGDMIVDAEHSDLPIRYFRIDCEKERLSNVLIEARTRLGAIF